MKVDVRRLSPRRGDVMVVHFDREIPPTQAREVVILLREVFAEAGIDVPVIIETPGARVELHHIEELVHQVASRALDPSVDL